MRPRLRFAARTIALALALLASGALTATSRAEDEHPKDNCDQTTKPPFEVGPRAPCLPPPPPLPDHPPGPR
jgi:hypothetical protein